MIRSPLVYDASRRRWMQEARVFSSSQLIGELGYELELSDNDASLQVVNRLLADGMATHVLDVALPTSIATIEVATDVIRPSILVGTLLMALPGLHWIWVAPMGYPESDAYLITRSPEVCASVQDLQALTIPWGALIDELAYVGFECLLCIERDAPWSDNQQSPVRSIIDCAFALSLGCVMPVPGFGCSVDEVLSAYVKLQSREDELVCIMGEEMAPHLCDVATLLTRGLRGAEVIFGLGDCRWIALRQGADWRVICMPRELSMQRTL